MTGRTRSTGSSTFWAVIGQGAGQGLSLLTFLVIARFVSKENFGIVAVCLATMECLRRVLIDPLSSAVAAKPGVQRRDFDVCFTLSAILSGVVTPCMIIFAPGIARLIGSPEAGAALRPVALILLAFGLAGTHGAWLVRGMHFRALALRSIASVVIGGAVGIALALHGFELWSLIFQQLTINVVNLVVLWSASDWRPRWILNWRDTKNAVLGARHISFAAIWNTLANDADIFFASAFFGPAGAGIYNAGKRIMLSATLVLVNTISAVTVPMLANIEHHRDRGASFLSYLRLTSVATAPAFAGLAAAAPDLVATILGPNWSAVAPVLVGLAAGGYALSLGQFATSALLVGQRSHIDSLVSAIAAMSNIVVFFLAVHRGPAALAAAASMTALLVTPVRMRFAIVHLDLSWRDIAYALFPSVVASLAMAALIWGLHGMLPQDWSPTIRLALIIGAGIGFYGLWLRLFAPGLFQMLVDIAVSLVGERSPRRDIEPG
ncbi:oligosaccharide flippase family protein [Sphingomonas oryzagri]|uniref:Oligosaccharide flippase family protein n=1 Tax=Sphingomonas oryzagri TaxID=3042314 RepID=A0ABT6N1P3_9SPHN|nr:oligosaccharide flippase family protein [Sphingomonas oryzagri]MDH7639194.1 oligosaccharide flippase family protein [Sphingomonas oryzagri]